MPHQQQQNVLSGIKEKSNSPLFKTNIEDNNEERAINNQEMNHKHANDTKNATNGQILHPSSITSNTNNISHSNQISAAGSNNIQFNKTIGSRQSSPTDEVNNVGSAFQLHTTGSEKMNSVNISNVQNSVVPNSVTKESPLIPSAGQGSSEKQQSSVPSAPTQQINIDTSGFNGQVN